MRLCHCHILSSYFSYPLHSTMGLYNKSVGKGRKGARRHPRSAFWLQPSVGPFASLRLHLRLRVIAYVRRTALPSSSIIEHCRCGPNCLNESGNVNDHDVRVRYIVLHHIPISHSNLQEDVSRPSNVGIVYYRVHFTMHIVQSAVRQIPAPENDEPGHHPLQLSGDAIGHNVPNRYFCSSPIIQVFFPRLKTYPLVLPFQSDQDLYRNPSTRRVSWVNWIWTVPRDRRIRRHKHRRTLQLVILLLQSLFIYPDLMFSL